MSKFKVENKVKVISTQCYCDRCIKLVGLIGTVIDKSYYYLLHLHFIDGTTKWFADHHIKKYNSDKEKVCKLT